SRSCSSCATTSSPPFAPTAAGSIRKAASTAANSCPAPICRAPTRPASTCWSRIADHAAKRHQRRIGRDQGLPALRKMQAGVRDLLRRIGARRSAPATAVAMMLLNATRPEHVKLARKLVVDWGYRLQRVAHRLLALPSAAQRRQPPSSTGQPAMRQQVVHFVNRKLPGGLPKRTARALLDIEDARFVPIIRDPLKGAVDSE